jgi:hypothetical protein
MPVNAPLLYLDAEGRLAGPTKREMKRLHPDGVVQDSPVFPHHRLATAS